MALSFSVLVASRQDMLFCAMVALIWINLQRTDHPQNGCTPLAASYPMHYSSEVTESFFLLGILPVAVILLIDGIGRAVEFGKYELPYRDHWLGRRIVRRDLRRVRLGQWVSALGLDLEGYIRATPFKPLRTQVDSCAHCTLHDQCERDMASRALLSRIMDYCPNAPWVGWLISAPTHSLGKPARHVA